MLYSQHVRSHKAITGEKASLPVVRTQTAGGINRYRHLTVSGKMHNELSRMKISIHGIRCDFVRKGLVIGE